MTNYPPKIVTVEQKIRGRELSFKEAVKQGLRTADELLPLAQEIGVSDSILRWLKERARGGVR